MTAHDLAVVTFEKTLMHCLVATAKEHTKSVVTWHIWDIHSWEIPNMGALCLYGVTGCHYIACPWRQRACQEIH